MTEQLIEKPMLNNPNQPMMYPQDNAPQQAMPPQGNQQYGQPMPGQPMPGQPMPGQPMPRQIVFVENPLQELAASKVAIIEQQIELLEMM